MYKEGFENRTQTPVKRDYYEVLGVSRDADNRALRSAFATIAKKTHPDTHPGDKAAEEAFKDASEAYSLLTDPKKRAVYDRFGFNGEPQWPAEEQDGGYYPPDREKQTQGKLRPKRDKDGIHLEDSFGRKVSDNFVELVNLGSIFVAKYRDGAYCVVNNETGKTVSRGFRRIELIQNFAIGTSPNGNKVIINSKNGRESKEYYKITIKDGRAYGKDGFFSRAEEVRSPY